MQDIISRDSTRLEKVLKFQLVENMKLFLNVNKGKKVKTKRKY